METAAADTYALTDDQLEFRDTIRQIVAERLAQIYEGTNEIQRVVIARSMG